MDDIHQSKDVLKLILTDSLLFQGLTLYPYKISENLLEASCILILLTGCLMICNHITECHNSMIGTIGNRRADGPNYVSNLQKGFKGIQNIVCVCKR